MKTLPENVKIVKNRMSTTPNAALPTSNSTLALNLISILRVGDGPIRQVFFVEHALEHRYPDPQQSAQQNCLPSIDVLQQGDRYGSPCAETGE